LANQPLSTSEYIERAYDADPQREWARLDRHRTEFALTTGCGHCCRERQVCYA